MIIRRVPEDFVVTERLSPDAPVAMPDAPGRPPGAWPGSDQRPFAWYRMRKESRATPEACAAFAAWLRVKPGAVRWAGLKDKHAVTEQTVSVRLEAGDAGPPVAVEGPGWCARLIGFSARHVVSSDIGANRFAITVRRLQRRDTGTFSQRIAMLTALDPAAGADVPGGGGRELLLANFFGDQRFGSARHGAGFAARALLRGDFESALRLLMATPSRKDSGPWRAFTRLAGTHWGEWSRLLDTLPRRPERGALEVLARGGTMRDAFSAMPAFTQQMCVEAYQSWLWNRAACALCERLDAGGVRADDAFGPMHFPRARFIDRDVERVSMPLPAPGIAPHEPWGPYLLASLNEEGLSPDALAIPGLRRPSFGSAERPLFVRASAFTISDPEPDDLAGAMAGGPNPKSPLLKRRLCFELPRGAYATVLLRALGQ